MAITTVSDGFTPEVAAEYASQAFIENLGMLELMGSGPDSPIQVVNDAVFAMEGQYLDRPVFKRISSFVSSRDINGTSAATDLELTTGNEQAVKMHKKVGPLTWTADVYRVTRARPGSIEREFGKQAGEQMALTVRESIISAIRGAVAAMTSTLHTKDVWNASTRTNFTRNLVQEFMDLFEDRQEKVSSLVSHSRMHGDLIKDYLGAGVQGITDTQSKQRILRDTLGRAVYMATTALLTTSDAGFDKYRALALGPGAVQIGFSQPLRIYEVFEDTSKESVLYRARADFEFWIGIAGMGYVDGVGGANPSDSTLATSSSWTPVYSDAREVLLGELVSNYSGN